MIIFQWSKAVTYYVTNNVHSSVIHVQLYIDISKAYKYFIEKYTHKTGLPQHQTSLATSFTIVRFWLQTVYDKNFSTCNVLSLF